MKNHKSLYVLAGVAIFLLFLNATVWFISVKAETLPSDEESEEECVDEDCADEEESSGCIKDIWDCGEWTKCSSQGIQTRTCNPEFDCPDADTPAKTSQTCTPPCSKDTWSCGEWSVCSGKGTQTRSCTKTFECPTAQTQSPSESQTCTPPPPPPPPPAEKPETQTQTPSAESKIPVTPPASPETPVTPPVQPEIPAINPTPAIQVPLEPIALSTSQQNQITQSEEEGSEEEIIEPQEETKEELDLQQALIAAQKLAEEQKQKIEEAAKKKFEESLMKKVQEELTVKQAEETKQKTETEKFKEMVKKAEAVVSPVPPAPPPPPDPLADADHDGILDKVDSNSVNSDVNQNGIPDGIDVQTSVSLTAPDKEEIQLQAQEKFEVQKLVIEQKMDKKEAEKTVKEKTKKLRTERKVEKIREFAEKKYNVSIKTHESDCNKDGISDEQAVSMGLDPCEKPAKPDAVTSAEAKIYSANPNQFGEKITMNVYDNYNLNSNGFTVLSACPKNELLTLYVIGKNGARQPLETKQCSENNKLVFSIEKQSLQNISEGKYLLKIEKAQDASSSAGQTSVISAAKAAAKTQPVASEPVVVNIVEDDAVPQPVIKSIEGMEIAGLRDIKVTAGEDGKIHVSGISDISTSVIGTFQTAVFTSAIMADVESGKFDIVSTQPLETGDHQVVIYAVKAEESTQSPPAKLRFSIIETAQAAEIAPVSPLTETQPAETRPAAEEKRFPTVIVVGLLAAAALCVGIGLYSRKKNTAN